MPKTPVNSPEGKLVVKYDSKFKACQRSRTVFEKQWYTNLAFYFGRHWIAWSPKTTGSSTSLQMIDPPAPNWRVRLTINRIKPLIRNEITKLSKEEPQFWVVPQSTEEGDVAAARAGENVSDYLIHSGYFNRVRRSAVFWSSVCGTGFIKTYYEPNTPDDTGSPGKICWKALSPFHLFFPFLQEEDIQLQPFLCHAATVDPEILFTQYGIEVDPDETVTGAHLDQKFFNALGIKTPKEEGLKQCYVKEFWVKPCREFKTGAMFITSNETMVYMYEGIPELPDLEMPNQMDMGAMDPALNAILQKPVKNDYPYEHGRYPFAKIDAIPTGRAYGESIINDLIPLQREYNRSRSQLIEAKNRTSKPQYTVTKGAIDPNKLTSEPGLVIEVTPGFQGPEALNQPDIPQYVLGLDDRTIKDMDEIAGQFEITKGRTPPGVEAASAIAYLQEENDTRLYYTVASIEEAVQEIGQQTLNLVDQFWDEERLIKVVSRNSVFETMMFKAADLKGNTDFRVESGSMAPRSRAARQAFLTEMMKEGFIPVEQGLKYLQMSETNRLYDESQLDTRQAQRENWIMAKGTLLPINEWDNDESHIMSHENYMKSQEFELLGVDLQAIFLAHCRDHKMRVAGGMPVIPGNIPGSAGSEQQDPNAPVDPMNPSMEGQPPLQPPQMNGQESYESAPV